MPLIGNEIKTENLRRSNETSCWKESRLMMNADKNSLRKNIPFKKQEELFVISLTLEKVVSR